MRTAVFARGSPALHGQDGRDRPRTLRAARASLRRKLHRRVPRNSRRGMQVAVDESLFSIDDARRLVDAEAADVAVIRSRNSAAPETPGRWRGFRTPPGKPSLEFALRIVYRQIAGFALALSLENADRAHELAHFLDEVPYAEWSHSISGGEFTLADALGHGSLGAPLPRREDSENHGMTEQNGPFTRSGE